MSLEQYYSCTDWRWMQSAPSGMQMNRANWATSVHSEAWCSVGRGVICFAAYWIKLACVLEEVFYCLRS
ncbi:UNVERIFIED_CONTAM: hypothetical protein K2H54_029071 [Gekko kuhli]